MVDMLWNCGQINGCANLKFIMSTACEGVFFKLANTAGENGVANSHYENLADCQKECKELPDCTAVDFSRTTTNENNCHAYFNSSTKLVSNQMTDHYVYSKCLTGMVGCLNMIFGGHL